MTRHPRHHAIIDHECRRLADALERLTVTLTERPDLAAMLDADGQTCADHLERLADFVTQAAKDYPEP